jgi:dipeptidyl aminopeptidase/acylaminoacyl peptidase
LLQTDGATPYEAISPSGKYAVYNFSTPQQPTQPVIRSTDDGRLISTFEKADPSVLFAAGYHPPEEFIAKSADGSSDLWCLVYKPSHLHPSKKYPVSCRATSLRLSGCRWKLRNQSPAARRKYAARGVFLLIWLPDPI